MAIAHDATSVASAIGTGDLSWTHTPSGTPKGVVVLVIQHNNSTDQVIGVTYGGTAMTEVAGSPVLRTAGDELGAVYGYFLGASVPTGAQTVLVDVDATGSTKFAVAATVTAASDTSVEDTEASDVATTALMSLTLATSVETMIYGAVHSGVDAPTGITPGADYTEISEQDFGATCGGWARRTSNASAGSPVCDWTINNQDTGALAIAVREGAGGAPPATNPYWGVAL